MTDSDAVFYKLQINGKGGGKIRTDDLGGAVLVLLRDLNGENAPGTCEKKKAIRQGLACYGKGFGCQSDGGGVAGTANRTIHFFLLEIWDIEPCHLYHSKEKRRIFV